MCALRAQSAVELEPDTQHISLANHTSLRKVWLVAHVALAPQACPSRVRVAGGHAATKHQLDKTSGSPYCVQRDCAAKFYSRKIM